MLLNDNRDVLRFSLKTMHSILDNTTYVLYVPLFVLHSLLYCKCYCCWVDLKPEKSTENHSTVIYMMRLCVIVWVEYIAIVFLIFYNRTMEFICELLWSQYFFNEPMQLQHYTSYIIISQQCFLQKCVLMAFWLKWICNNMQAAVKLVRK